MRREDLADLTAFLAVAEERSFIRAAARPGDSQSSLSQIVHRLEARLGLRLLTRTTRSVAVTEAGQQLIDTLRPAINEVEAKLTAPSELREKPSGTVRVTTGRLAAETILWPALKRLA
jgi:DNA-binding transcriptional LysR family regulator